MGRRRRFGVLALTAGLVSAVCLVYVGSAQADAEVRIRLTSPRNLTILADLVDKNSLRVSRTTTGRFHIEELNPSGSRLDPGPACDAVDSRHVSCDASKADGGNVVILLRGSDDILRIVGNLGFPVEVQGGTGNDDIEGSTNRDIIDGESGLDTIKGSLGNDSLTGGLDADRLAGGLTFGGIDSTGDGDDSFSGGGGNDFIHTRDGVAESIFCGGGDSDDIFSDLADQRAGVISECEGRTFSDRREGSTVRIKARSLRVRRNGRLPVRLSCPRDSSGCKGRLTIRGLKGKRVRRLGSRRYVVRAGRSRTVRVLLKNAGRGFKRARATASERGRHGPITATVVRRLRTR